MALTARQQFKKAYSMFRDANNSRGTVYAVFDAIGVSCIASAAALEAKLANDGRHDPVPLATRLAQHKMARIMWPAA